MVGTIIWFCVGLIMLIKGGDWFVDGATGVAHRFHVPELIIGATVVSIGTTLPEVMVSATSAVSGHGQIAYGNAIGSIICNTALIAALTIAVSPSPVNRKTLKTPVLFFFLAAAFYMVTAYTTGQFTRLTGVILLLIFVCYMLVTIVSMKNGAKSDAGQAEEATETEEKSMAMDLLLLVAGAAFIAIGANLLVNKGTLIAEAMGVPESVIALTMIALGTSLPELVTAVTSLVKGHASLSLGNIVGANLFNLVLVTGISSLIAPFSIPVNSTIAGINSTLVVDLPLMVFVMAVLTIPALVRQKLTRFQGIGLLLLYVAFCAYQFLVV
jgi:cation:H+ antiporter